MKGENILTSKNILKEKYFHIYENKRIENQGIILDEIKDNYYLVCFLSWISGAPTASKIFHIAGMTEWKLYHSQQAMQEAHDRDCTLNSE